MFDHDVTMELIRRAQQGDEQAKTRLIEENTPLLKSIIRRYVGKGQYDSSNLFRDITVLIHIVVLIN